MGEALGIDLRVAVCAAARRRGDEVEPCMLGGDTATAAAVDVMPAGVGAVTDAAGAMSAMLTAVADRAMPGEPVTAVDAVGVAFAVTPDDGPRVLAEHAALAAFPTPLLVPRPVAVAAWFLHQNLRPNDVTLAVLEVDAGAVSVALVRRGRDGAVELAGFPAALPPAGDDVDLAAHLDGAVGLLDAALARAGVTSASIDTIVLAGEPAWLGQLAVQAGVATGVGTIIDPQPELAAALGATLLAGGPERRLDAAGLALLGPFLLAGHVPHVGGAAGTAGAGAAVGAALSGEAAGEGVGSVAGQALVGNGATALRDKTVPGQGLKSGGPAGGSSGGGFPGALGGLLGNKGLVAGALAALATLVIVGAVVAGAGGGDDDSVAAAGPDVTEPDDDVATTDDDPGDDASSTTVGSSTTTTPDSSTTVPGTDDPGADDPGTPADPGTPGDPGVTPGGLAAPGDPPSSPGTTASTTTTTTAPRDTTPPAIGVLVASPTDINESGSEFCTPPATAAATARVTDASGIRSVTLSYTGNGQSGGGAMSGSGGSWTRTIGPFPDSQLTVGQSATVTFTVTAVDNAGNSSTASSKLTLHGC